MLYIGMYCCRIVIVAGDTSPIDVICHMPLVCEEKDIPYCYVPSKEVNITPKYQSLHILSIFLESCMRLACVEFAAC